MLLVVSVPIFVLVMTVVVYSVTRFAAKPGDMRDGPPIHGNTRLEVIWVTIPFLMVTGLAIYGWIVLDDIEAKQQNEMVVNVTGQQFAWTFEYPGQNVNSNELVLPVDRPIDFRIKTNDVLHSFWVPAFRLKSDAVPVTTRFASHTIGWAANRWSRRALRYWDAAWPPERACGVARAFDAWIEDQKRGPGASAMRSTFWKFWTRWRLP